MKYGEGSMGKGAAPAAPTAQRPFAVFDIDGTIVRTSLFLQIVDELIAAGHLPADTRARLDTKLEAYQRRAHGTAFSDYVQLTVEILFNNLPKVSVADYRLAVDKVIGRTHLYTYVYTRDLITSLKKQGYFLIALSGSENYSIRKFTEHYGFDVAVGDNYKQKDGYFTGVVESVIHDKGVTLQRLIAEYDLSSKGSLAIGDSHSDGKMLELVEKPIAFNPEDKLLKLASERGWPVVLERKNVIYHLEPKNGSYILAQTNL